MKNTLRIIYWQLIKLLENIDHIVNFIMFFVSRKIEANIKNIQGDVNKLLLHSHPD